MMEGLLLPSAMVKGIGLGRRIGGHRICLTALRARSLLIIV